MVTFFAQVVGGVNEHAAAAAGRVVNGVAWLRFKNPDEGVHDFGRSEELASLRARVVSELLDEVFVGAAKNVAGNAFVGEIVFIEVLNQSMDNFVGDQRLA